MKEAYKASPPFFFFGNVMTTKTTTTATMATPSSGSTASAPKSAMAPTQESATPSNINTTHFATLSSRLFLSHLSSIPYAKTLILDPTLAGPLGIAVHTDSLKSVGVERMFWMDQKDSAGNRPRGVNAPTKAVVYVCRPEEKWLSVIKAHITHDLSSSGSTTSSSSPKTLAHTYHALLTPHRTELSLLSLSPVLPHLQLFDFGMELVPLDKDLLSLEEPDAAWAELYLTGDQSILHRCAMTLMTCQMLWGCFPRITGKGDLSKRLADLLVRQRREHLATDPENPSMNTLSRVVDGLVIVERGTDLVTPMCSQLTYAGLLDEHVGIKSTYVEVEAEWSSGIAPQAPQSQQASGATGTPSGSSTPLVTPSPARLQKRRLDDLLWHQIRDLNFSVVGTVLHHFAKQLSTSYDDRHAAKTVSEMRAFVGKLGGLKGQQAALRLHTILTEKLMAETNSEAFNRSLEIQQNIVAGLDLTGQMTAIGDLIDLEAPLETVLRLLCLMSVTQGGIKSKFLDHFKREIGQTYGYEHVLTILVLEAAGLLTNARGSGEAGRWLSGPASVLSPFSSNAVGSSGSGSAAAAAGAGSASAFERVRQPLRLINDEVSESDPTDVAYVYSGYAPLSIRLIQAVGQKEALVGGAAAAAVNTSGATQPQPTTADGDASAPRTRKPRAHPLVGWKGFEDVVDAIPGETFDFVQSISEGAVGIKSGNPQQPTKSSAEGQDQKAKANANAPWSTDPDRRRTTVVFFLGGITFAEIAAIRFMSRQSRNRSWLIVTTGIVTGNRLLKQCMSQI